MDYKEENKELCESFLERTYLKEWKKDKNIRENWNRLELQTSYDCNLNCRYCYINNYEDELYHGDDKDIVKNTEMVIDWLVDNEYNPKIDFFGGEPLVNKRNYDILDMMLDKLSAMENTPPAIVIPTNYTWIKDDSFIKEVERLLKKSRKMDIPIYLSASIDGKYCADNRPPVIFTDEEYEKIFSFNKRWGFSYHPMIYSEEIENWKDNFLWFEKMLKRYDIPYNNIYLLEVRNKEWSDEDMIEFHEFIKWLINHMVNEMGKDRYIKFLFDDGFNLLRNMFTSVGRGIGCSIQATIFLRLNDLTFNMCHRTSYEEYMLGNLDTDGDKVTGIDIDKPELLIGHTTFNQMNQPMCEDCMIRNLCTGQCIGSQYETTGDLFSPIPTVCQLEYMKLAALIKGHKDVGLLDRIKKRITDVKEYEIEIIEELL